MNEPAGPPRSPEWATATLNASRRPIAFEVFADEFAEMEAQAREITSRSEHVFVW